MKQLHPSGIGVSRKQAEPITPNKEERLWQSGHLGDGSSQSLFNTVFYYNCKLFGMRAMDEHRSLKCSQFCAISNSLAVRQKHWLEDYASGISTANVLDITRQSVGSAAFTPCMENIFH